MKQWQSIIDNTETQTTLGTQETVTINNRQYRDTDNIGHTGSAQCCLCLWLSIIDFHCFLCAPCCLCLCILYYWLSLFHVCPMLSVSLYCLLLIVTVSCVPNVVCVSVLSIIDCHCFLCAQCCLCLCILYYWLWLNNREYRNTDNIGNTVNSNNP
jgi:hypothetical protein